MGIYAAPEKGEDEGMQEDEFEVVDRPAPPPPPPPTTGETKPKEEADDNDNNNMAPSTLDLAVLTFNCAKNLINVAVFASHLRAALSQNATGLPDLVVFSLQEVAPLSYSFIGSYFLSPYYARFEEALNLAAVQIEASTPPTPPPDAAAGADEQTPPPVSSGAERRSLLWSRRQTYPYQLVRAKNVGMSAIMLFARTPAAVHHIEEAECGFGAADMGNKGAVGLRITYADAGLLDEIGGGDGGGGEGAAAPERRTTQLTFVATHLAAMEWNLRRRNANWRSIVSGLTFANPKSVLPHAAAATHDTTSRPPIEAFGAHDLPESEPDVSVSVDNDNNEDAQPLLARNQRDDNDAAAALRDVSVFRPGSHLFLAGDLNYRISTTTPPPLAAFPRLDAGSEDYWPRFLERDQLTQERTGGRTLHGLEEAEVRFPPTYKVVVMSHAEGAENEGEVRAAAAAAAAAAAREAGGKEEAEEVVPWRWASHRWPGWCDRVLYLDLPGWVKRRIAAAAAEEGDEPRIEVKAYDSLPVMRTSDHRPVFLRAEVPILTPEEMGLPADGEELVEGEENDPRLRLPAEIDVGAWERRAAARRREIVVGWSAFLWSTREGAMLIATAVVFGIGGWWIYQGLF